MGTNRQQCQPTGDRYVIPTRLLDMIEPDASRWALPVTLAIHRFVQHGGPRPLPDSVLAEQVGCSTQTISRVRPALRRIFRWNRPPGGAYVYALRDDIPDIRGAGVTFVPAEPLRQACRIGATAAAALISLASFSTATGRVHPDAHWDGTASRALMTAAALRRAVETLAAAGVLPEDPSRNAHHPLRSRSCNIAAEYPDLIIPQPRGDSPADWKETWRETLETASARSDPRRCGRKGGLIRWRGHHPTEPPTRPAHRPPTKFETAQYIYKQRISTKASPAACARLEPISYHPPQEPPPRRRPGRSQQPTGLERRMLTAHQGIPDAAEHGLTDHQRLLLHRRASKAGFDCECLDGYDRRDITARALRYAEETLIRHRAASVRPDSRRTAITNPGGWAWTTLRNRMRLLAATDHTCPVPEEPPAPPTAESATDYRNNLLRLAINPALYQTLLRHAPDYRKEPA